MNYYELGAGAVAGLSILSWIGYVHWQLNDLKSKLLSAEEAAIDAQTVENTRKLSDDELNLLVGKGVGKSDSNT